MGRGEAVDDAGGPAGPDGRRASRHAGHADIVRELIEGRAGKDHDAQGDREWWASYVAGIEEAAGAFENGVDCALQVCGCQIGACVRRWDA